MLFSSSESNFPKLRISYYLSGVGLNALGFQDLKNHFERALFFTGTRNLFSLLKYKFLLRANSYSYHPLLFILPLSLSN